MKTFMTFVWILIFGAAMTGCTTFECTNRPNAHSEGAK